MPSTVPFDARSQRLEILQAIELSRLERARRHGSFDDHFDDVGRQADDFAHLRAQFAVQLVQQIGRLADPQARGAPSKRDTTG